MLTNTVHLIYILYVYIKEYLVKILKNKLSYLRAKAYGTVRQRNDWESPRKKKLPFFVPKFPVLHLHDGCNKDPRTHERNLMLLQEEEEKLHPNREVVMDIMKKTFYVRRQNILKASTSVSNLLKIYPSLRNYDQVSAYVNYQGCIR